MKKYIKPRFLIVTLFFCNVLSFYSQKTKEIIISRENIPPKAVVELVSSETIYVGQEYTLSVGVSGDYDVNIEVENGEIIFDEQSKRHTGGLIFTLIPTDTGECYIQVRIMNENEIVASLLSRIFRVEKSPQPTIFINSIQSGSVINELNSETKISCKYPPVYGVSDNYEIKNWTVNVGDKIFSGSGEHFTEELIKYINETSISNLYINVELKKNKTKQYFSEAIFIVKK
jgi:hypothetical protein